MTGRFLHPLCLLILLTGSLPCHAGAWTQQQGGFYLKASLRFLQTAREFDHHGRRQSIEAEQFVSTDAAFQDISLYLYGELGLRDDLTFVAQMPLKYLQSERRLLLAGGQSRPWERLRTAGVGDLGLGLRRSLLTGATTLSTQAGLSIPAGYDRKGEEGPPLGGGRPTAQVQLLIGQSLDPFPAYLGGRIGYRFRRGALHDELTYGAEVGARAGRMQLKVGVDGVQNRSTPPDVAGTTVVTPLPGGGGVVPRLIVGDQHWTQVSPSILCSITDRLGLQVELARAVAGANTLASTSYAAALVFTD